ncbi:MAG: lysine biosynthesis protein LysW [Anaerolineaceae bacterium]|nr:lysine biosynthesis protein LysW [Anaerolineaceae bacterium]
MNHNVTCVECDADINIPTDVMENELLACPDCGVELEVLSLNPLTVDLAPEVEEDWGE